MIPPRLHGLSYNEIVRYVYMFRSLSSSRKDKLKLEWIDRYHIQKNVTCPFKAVDELAWRLMYEVLTGTINHHHIDDDTWLLRRLRDSGHDERIKRLVSCIFKDTEALNYARCYRWMNVERALKLRS